LSFGTLHDIWRATAEVIAVVPDSVYSVVLLGIALIAALLAQRIIRSVSRRALSVRHPNIYVLIERLRGPIRLALILFAVSLTLPALPVNADIKLAVAKILQLALIVLAGWMTVTCINILADMYLRQFDIEAADNLLARKHVTQVRVLKGTLHTVIILATIAAALMTFDSVRQYGVGLFASAGIAGIVVGLAARPVLSNLLAGVQLAVTQPIRIDDVVVVENEWGRIEDITPTYVVIRIWDLRRLIVPLSYFIEKPFENWTRKSSNVLGTVYLYTDYSVPVERVREKLAEIVKQSELWDGAVANVQVTDSKERTVEVRALVSARDSGAAWNLRCQVREQLINFLQQEYPAALPRQRVEIETSRAAAGKEPIGGGPPAAVREAEMPRAPLGQRGR